MVDDGMRMFHHFSFYILLLNLRVGQYPHIASTSREVPIAAASCTLNVILLIFRYGALRFCQPKYEALSKSMSFFQVPPILR